MQAVRFFTPENRLAKILDCLDAPQADVLIAEAHDRVATLGEAIRAFVAEKLDILLPFADQSEDVLFAECRTLADAAMNIAEVAAAAQLDAVGEIARGITAMIDGLVTLGVWHSDALRLHIRSLGLVGRSRGPQSDDDAVIVENLRLMRLAIGLKD